MTDAVCSRAIHTIADVPPSVEAVFCALYERDPMTSAELRDDTGLPRRTLYSALKRLRELGVLKERLSLRDTRQTYFWIDGETVAAAS